MYVVDMRDIIRTLEADIRGKFYTLHNLHCTLSFRPPLSRTAPHARNAKTHTTYEECKKDMRRMQESTSAGALDRERKSKKQMERQMERAQLCMGRQPATRMTS